MHIYININTTNACSVSTIKSNVVGIRDFKLECMGNLIPENVHI